MKKTLLLLLAITFLSCSSDEDEIVHISPGQSDEELRTELSDSLLNVYKGTIDNPSSLKDVTVLVNQEKTVLSGKTNNNLWIGIFNSPSDKVIEGKFPSETEGIENYLIRGSGFISDEDEFMFDAYLVHTDYEDDLSDFPHHRFLFKHNELSNDLKVFRQRFEEGAGNEIESVTRGFEDSYLVLTDGMFFTSGSSDIIYLDADFGNSEVWTNSYSCLPSDEVVFLDKKMYYTDSGFLINGMTMIDCYGWSVNVLKDIFNYDYGCIPCHLNTELLSQSTEELVFEITFRNKARNVVIDSYTGNIISNETVE